MAVLARTNARLADFEEAFHDAGIPFQGSSLLEREAARRMLRLLERDSSTGVAERVRALAEEAGMLYSLPDKLGERELTRQADLARLVRLAEELDDGELTGAGVRSRAPAALRLRQPRGARGVHLLTYHRAKGLEFDAVFLPRLDEKELPTRLAQDGRRSSPRSAGSSTSASRGRGAHLAITWSRDPSPFLAELGIETRPARRRAQGRRRASVPTPSCTTRSPRGGRSARRPRRSLPTSSSTTRRSRRSPARSRARSTSSPRSPGVGPAKLERYGDEVLAVVAAA